MLELIAIAISLGIGFLIQNLSSEFQIKMILFCVFPLTTLLLLLPLPNGSTALAIFKKFIIYSYKQKKYKLK